MNSKYLLVIFILYFNAPASKVFGLSVNKIFGSHMVLQQNAKVMIWGNAGPGTDIKIATSWNKKTYTCKAGTNHKWKTYIYLRISQAW